MSVQNLLAEKPLSSYAFPIATMQYFINIVSAVYQGTLNQPNAFGPIPPIMQLTCTCLQWLALERRRDPTLNE